MSHQRKNFIDHNEGFKCLHCGFENGPSDKSCRNHCRSCLYSQHVDQEVPGDRASACFGLMKPIEIDEDKKKGKMLLHECMKCHKQMRNKLADDDDLDAIIELGLKPLTG